MNGEAAVAVDTAVAPAPAAGALEDPVAPAAPAGMDAGARILASTVRNHLRAISATSARSQQSELGMSELEGCPRRVAYRLAGTRPVHFPEVLPALVGTGLHAVLEAGVRRLDQGIGRYLIEHRVRYRTIPGTVDLYDRWEFVVTDYKTTRLAKIRKIAASRPPLGHQVQIAGYAGGLREQGLRVDDMALVYIPVDGSVDDIYVARAPVNLTLVDSAIDRVSELAAVPPAAVPAQPTPLCGWCPFYSPAATDLAVSCPGQPAK